MLHMTRSTSKRSKGEALGLGVGVRKRRKAEDDKWEEGSRELRVIKAINLERISSLG